MSTPASNRTIILGGGPAGLTAAWVLTREGIPAVVLEQDPQLVGGIARTVERDGYRFDIGGHRFFTKSAEINRLWEEILGDELRECPRLSRIFYRGRFFNYPLEALDAFLKLGPWETVRVLASYLRAKARPIRPELSFQDWVSNRFGRRLFSIFFKSYTEKVWGIPCSEISADWAAQRIKGLSLRAAILHALGLRPAQPTAKTLLTRFRYPRLGPGQMWETATEQIRARGGEVLLDRRVEEIRWTNDRVLSVAGRDASGDPWKVTGDQFISSIALRDLILGMRPPPPPDVLEAACRLRYRDFLSVCLVIDRAEIFPDTWIYIHEPNVRVGRIQNYKNWSRAMVPDPAKTVLGLEYFCFEGDEFWKRSDAELNAQAEREAIEIGLVKPGEIQRAHIVRLPKAYPIYDRDYRARLDVIRAWLGRISNLQPVGRNGLHAYNNQDHSMMTAMLASHNILAGNRRYDPWRVNTDAEYLEADPLPERTPR
jgi:protoporphyrinogen oxidase